MLSYVLITPARNEQAFLGLTIQSVCAQTVRPLRWVIVSDGSTDRTDEIVEQSAARYDWIHLLKLPPRATRDFGGKARCFNKGYESVKNLSFTTVGSLDADITFEGDYFEFLLGKMEVDPKLGLTGTPFSEDGMTYDYRFSSTDHVSGACQLFRRDCFEEIGGYVPLPSGGIDTLAVLMARMKGWRTRTFTEKHCVHHRPMGSANCKSPIGAAFKLGRSAYRLGSHPLWQLCRSFYQMTKKPYVIQGVADLSGYVCGLLNRDSMLVSEEVVAFQRSDQMNRLRRFVCVGVVRDVNHAGDFAG